MEQKDRDQLDFCCEHVVPKINMLKLWPKLLEYKIYNRDDVNIPRWARTLNSRSTVEDVYLTIKTRGPHAFKNLLLSLRHSDHDNVADILEGTVIRQQNYPFQHNVQESNEPLQIKLRKATKFLDTPDCDKILRYPMRSKPRGLVLIITNIYYNSVEKPRFSAIHDEDNLRVLFEEMGFEVVTHQNLTGQKIKEVVKAFSRRDDLQKVHSCFVIITSHGTEDKENQDTEIQGVDYENLGEQVNYEKVLCKEIKDYFTAEACPHLAEKPKIFIFQLCRGKKKQIAVTPPRLITDTRVFPTEEKEPLKFVSVKKKKQTVRNYADMLVAHSTLPGYVAYRDSITGSWFITILCKVFMEHACTNHIQDLFNLIDAELNVLRATNDECQTLSIESTGFNKHCYLNPGLFEDV